MNYNGQDVELAQHNMDIAVPFVLSRQLWRAVGQAAITRFGDPRPYGLASRDLKISDAEGKPGGFTADTIGGAVKLARRAGHQLPVHQGPANWPKSAPGRPPRARPSTCPKEVTWEGTWNRDKAGVHKFQLYGSGYFKLYADDKLMIDGWRQNWNPWYHNFELPMTAGKPLAVGRVAAGRRLHRAAAQRPVARGRAAFAVAGVGGGQAIDYYYIAGASRTR